MNIRLYNTVTGKKYKIIKIIEDDNLKQKLLDFGFINGAVIMPIFDSMSEKSRGYEINGFVIGLRNTDASKVIVSEYSGGSNND